MKRKILGLGIAGIVFLMLSAATLIPATATPVPVETISPDLDDVELDIITDTIEKIFSKYKDDLAEIDAYVEDYKAKHGFIDENFELPERLQMKFNNIVNELDTVIGDIHPLSKGGVNDFIIQFHPGGYQVWIYLDNFWTGVLNYFGTFGVAAIAALLTYLSGGLLAIVAIFIAGTMIAYGIDNICDHDEGNGVVIYIMRFLMITVIDVWAQ